MAQTSAAGTPIENIGSFSECVMGVAGGSGTSTVVTVNKMATITQVLVGGATSATAPYCDTVSANTFTVTHGNGDKFVYIARGKPKL